MATILPRGRGIRPMNGSNAKVHSSSFIPGTAIGSPPPSIHWARFQFIIICDDNRYRKTNNNLPDNAAILSCSHIESLFVLSLVHSSFIWLPHECVALFPRLSHPGGGFCSVLVGSAISCAPALFQAFDQSPEETSMCALLRMITAKYNKSNVLLFYWMAV